MALKFSYRHFNAINFYIKTDDDMLINYPLLFNIIKNIHKNNRSIYGHYSKEFIVINFH